VVEIPGIAEDETADFLKQRLGGDLGTLDDWFTADTLARFAEEANGNPGVLLALAREVSGDTRPTASHPDRSRLSRLQSLLQLGEHPSAFRRWAPLALVPLAVLVWLALKPSAPAVPELLPEQTPPTVTAMDSAPPTSASPLDASSTNGGSQRIEIILPPAPSAPGEAHSGEALGASQAADGLAPPTALPDSPAPADGALAAGAEAATERATPATPTVAEAPPPSPAPILTKPDKKPAVSTSKPQAKPSQPAAKPVKPKPTPRPAPAATASAKPGTGYALQFFGVTERKAASNFIARHNLGDRARIIDSKREGKPWFVVVYGAYPTRAAAQNAAGRLPPAVQREVQPWVRDVKSLNALPR
jgi:DamX protein